MRQAAPDEEAQVLGRLVAYRNEYRQRRLGALAEERERREAAGETSLGGCWVPRNQAAALRGALARRRLLAAAESLIGIALLGALALGFWQLFAFLFLP